MYFICFGKEKNLFSFIVHCLISSFYHHELLVELKVIKEITYFSKFTLNSYPECEKRVTFDQ